MTWFRPDAIKIKALQAIDKGLTLVAIKLAVPRGIYLLEHHEAIFSVALQIPIGEIVTRAPLLISFAILHTVQLPFVLHILKHRVG
jgi:hypothetical protein